MNKGIKGWPQASRLRTKRGGEIAYVETTAQNAGQAVTATVEASATVLLTLPDVVFDPGIPVMLDFFTPRCEMTTNNFGQVKLFLDGVTQGEIARCSHILSGGVGGCTGGFPLRSRTQFFPQGGRHSYSIRAITDAGTATFYGGDGTSTNFVPMFCRLSSVGYDKTTRAGVFGWPRNLDPRPKVLAYKEFGAVSITTLATTLTTIVTCDPVYCDGVSRYQFDAWCPEWRHPLNGSLEVFLMMDGLTNGFQYGQMGHIRGVSTNGSRTTDSACAGVLTKVSVPPAGWHQFSLAGWCQGTTSGSPRAQGGVGGSGTVNVPGWLQVSRFDGSD